MDKYEISLWEDYPDPISHTLKERKIAVIGSDTMDGQTRAIEPNLVEDINGTHTFTFKMYYSYVDNETGEKYDNPFGRYLINERKIKVFWKNEWYDLVIKKCQEDSSKKSVTYTCTDLFINELSKQGYSLEFDTDLQNNIGTAAELATSVLEGSTWMYDDVNSTPIVQRTEGPVYEVNTSSEINAILQSPNEDQSVVIPANKKVLLFYDSIVEVLEEGGQNTPTQFIYSADGYKTDINDLLVTNGDCYQVNVDWARDGDYLNGTISGNLVFQINLVNGVSKNYRAARLVRSQKTEYDPLLNRYVLLCEDSNHREIYEIATTEYTNPLAVVNVIANPTEFSSVSGWIGKVEEFGLFPKFGTETELSTYSAKSYLKLLSGDTYNAGIQANISYFTPTEMEIQSGIIGGIQKGEKYVFRVKAKLDVDGSPGDSYIDTNIITGNLYKYDTNYIKTGNALFINVGGNPQFVEDEGWLEYTLECNTSVSASELNEYGLFINSSSTIWIEDIQFFKYAEGVLSYDDDAPRQRMNPGEISLQSVVNPVYKYYYKNSVTSIEELTYLYVGDTRQYTPIYNNYEKIGTISDKESNRFNILQSIAETFQAWVKFRIDHEDNGEIKIIDGVPQKYVYFVEEIGEDTGISFEYGIDLKTINRTIDSDKLATKIIVKPNNNEFAPNGFCSIARSQWNYSKETFILNLDYYTQQGLLDKETLDSDLYSIDNENYIGYYYWLHKYNTEYDNNAEALVQKNMDLTRQISEQKVYEQYLLAAHSQLESIESDMISLAGVTQWSDAQTYARTHASNEKVQALLNAHGKIENEIDRYNGYLTDINNSIDALKTFINNKEERQQVLLGLAAAKHKEFNDKYSTYLMEGTWQDEDYVDDDEYYLDGLKVAYTSSRPQLSYSISVLRLSSLEEYSSKVFKLGDICYMQDREFFGYLPDKITPYKEKILVSKISSFFDQPEKDVLTIQNYKSRFDDLFQRIAATTQSLQYQEGAFTRAANIVNLDKTLNFSVFQDTFEQNQNLVINSSNQNVTWDDTGITITNKFNGADKTKIIAGGIFVTNDGGESWKNAVSGNGISTNLLTAGRVDTSQIQIYDEAVPSFRWDSNGITAYAYNSSGAIQFNKFVRQDKYGFYGYDGNEDFIPSSIADIKREASFGFTWDGFFLKTGETGGMFEIAMENLIVRDSSDHVRIQLGRLDNTGTRYGLIINNSLQQTVFTVDEDYVKIAGWTVTPNAIETQVVTATGTKKVGLYSAPGANEYCISAGDSFGVQPDGSILINAGTIGGCTVSSSGISGGDFIFTSDGLKYNSTLLTSIAINSIESISLNNTQTQVIQVDTTNNTVTIPVYQLNVTAKNYTVLKTTTNTSPSWSA